MSNKAVLDNAKQKLEEIKKELWQTCSLCGGTGKEKCISCHGAGRVKYYITASGEVEGVDYNWGPCTLCDGKGSYSCENCNGRGGYYKNN